MCPLFWEGLYSKFMFILFYSLCPSRLWRRLKTSPRGGLWSGLRRRRVPVTWVQSVTLRPLGTRCPGTCPNTIASSAPSQPLEMCWTRQRGPSSASQVRCSRRKNVDVCVQSVVMLLVVLILSCRPVCRWYLGCLMASSFCSCVFMVCIYQCAVFALHLLIDFW